MKLKIGEKELNIKFGYKPTLKERLISRIVKLTDEDNEGKEKDTADVMVGIEDILLFLPEILLIGLQVHHEEYRYDYDTKEGKEEQLSKVFDLIDEYSMEKDADLMKLFEDLQNEMQNDSFLAGLFRKEQKAEQAEKAVQKKNKEN